MVEKKTEKIQKPKVEESEVKDNIESQLLVPLDYTKIRNTIGTKFKNKSIEEFIFKTKQNGLKIMDIEKINERILMAAKLLSDYEPGEIMLICRRETGHKPVKKLAEVTGMRCITGRYLPGTISNAQFSFFTEPKIMVVQTHGMKAGNKRSNTFKYPNNRAFRLKQFNRIH
jgi:ribosomal protein uS2